MLLCGCLMCFCFSWVWYVWFLFNFRTYAVPTNLFIGTLYSVSCTFNLHFPLTYYLSPTRPSAWSTCCSSTWSPRCAILTPPTPCCPNWWHVSWPWRTRCRYVKFNVFGDCVCVAGTHGCMFFLHIVFHSQSAYMCEKLFSGAAHRGGVGGARGQGQSAASGDHGQGTWYFYSHCVEFFVFELLVCVGKLRVAMLFTLQIIKCVHFMRFNFLQS